MNASRFLRLLIPVFRCAVTLTVVIAGAHAARLLWRHYRIEPWTRDGRVNAESVTIVPEVSGKVSSILVSDNQEIRKGEILFEIDAESYRLALQSAEAVLATRQHELDLAQEQAARRRPLAGQHAISAEELQKAESVLAISTSARDAAVSARDTAKLNLDRTIIVSPVNGFITNLHLRQGDYAAAGQAQFSVIDRDSFWVAAYFEETKIPAIHGDDKVRIDLMGGSRPLHGHVESMSRGIADPTTAGKGLANVDPVFNWVRLAQRIPVRIHLDEVPADLFLSSGMTCNVHVLGGGVAEKNETPAVMAGR